MPFKDEDRRRAYQRQRYRDRRELEKSEAERPELPELWDFQLAIWAMLESSTPPRSLVVRKAARTGLTTLLLVYMLTCAQRGERTALWAPNAAMGREISRLKFKPMVCEADLDDRPTDFRYTLKGGGYCLFKWTGSGSSFRSTDVDFACSDETSEDAPDVLHQGSIDQLLAGRVRSSPNPRTVFASSPATVGDALLHAEARTGVQLEWRLPCPSCGRGVSPRLDRLSAAGLACEHCGAISPQPAWSGGRFEGVEEPNLRVRDGVLYDGDVPRDWPASTGLILRGLISPNVPWARHLESLEAAGDDPSALKAVYSITDAELNVAAAGRIKELLAERRPVERRADATVVAGADIQHDRIEVTLAQLGPEGRVDVLTHLVLEGETVNATEGAWASLSAVLAEWKPAMTMIDSGDRTRVVYTFVRRHRGTRALKGRRELANGRLWTWSPPKPDEGKPIGLYSVDVDTMRRTWMNRLDSATRGDWFKFDIGLDRSYFESLTAEREIVTRSKRTGAYKRGWTSTGDHEAGDCMTYVCAASLILRNRRPAKRHRIRFAQ